MRTKNGKRSGSVPITLVAVFALVAILSVSLVTLVPNDVQAQVADPSIVRSGTSQPDIVLDVGENAPTVNGAILFTYTAGEDASMNAVDPPRTYEVSSDQDLVDDPDTMELDERLQGDATAIRTNGDSAPITISSSTGDISISGVGQGHADLADNTARITVTASFMLNDRTHSASSSFNVTVLQNPNEVEGDAVTAADPPTPPHSCTLIVGDDGTAGTGATDIYTALAVPTSASVNTPIIAGTPFDCRRGVYHLRGFPGSGLP